MRLIPPLAMARERCAVMRLVIDLTLACHDSIYWPHDVSKKETNANLALICAAVVLGHAEGNPMTQTEIAKRVRQPRPTVARKLDRLERMGVITRVGARYVFAAKRAEHVPMLARFEDILRTAFAVLGPSLASKSDERPE